MRSSLILFLVLGSLMGQPLFAQDTELAGPNDLAAIQPFDVDYQKLAFYPKRWKEAKLDFGMLAWEGQNLVFLTPKKRDYDSTTLTKFVRRLDQGWAVYREMVGAEPRLIREVNGKATICALPKANLSCGYGCGFVGATGIEVSAFDSVDWPNFVRNDRSFQHYYFYEMGRNYFVFGDRHSLFTTGYAVFMRYVCMDRLKCVDLDAATRRTIESCEEIYARSQLSFFGTFTNLGSGEKSNRLRDRAGQVIAPSDQPVMYATAMMKLRKDHGGDIWVQRFYHRLRTCPARKATDEVSARTQCYNWLVCASFAARKDLTFVFVDRWRMPFNDRQRQIMKSTDWENNEQPAAEVVNDLLTAASS